MKEIKIKKITVISLSGNITFEVGTDYCGYTIDGIYNYSGVYEVVHKGNTLVSISNCGVVVEYEQD